MTTDANEKYREAADNLAANVKSFVDGVGYVAPEQLAFHIRVKLAEPLENFYVVTDQEAQDRAAAIDAQDELDTEDTVDRVPEGELERLPGEDETDYSMRMAKLQRARREARADAERRDELPVASKIAAVWGDAAG